MLSTSPCNLCPRRCGALRDRGQRGVCGADDQLLVARASLHFWEEPPLSGTGGSGAVFFSHCPLKCVYCQNAVVAAGQVGWRIDEGRLARICLELQQRGALNVNFVTPTHHSLAIRRAVLRSRAAGLEIPVVWNTSGYETVEAVDAASEVADVFLADFKYADPALAQRYSRARDYPEVALSAIERMAAAVGPATFDVYDGQRRMTRGVVVRHLLLPGALDNSKRALERLWATLGDSVDYSLMNQYTPLDHLRTSAAFPELGRPPAADEYEELLDFADALGMEDYYWQDGPAAQESFIPVWNGEGVLEPAEQNG